MNEKTEQKKQWFWLILFVMLGSWFRRLFGGGFGKLGLITRFWKYLILALIVLLMYYVKGLLYWNEWRIYAGIASFSIHWAVGHGDYFFVYSTVPDEGRIKWIDWILRKWYGEGNYYGLKGNLTGLLLRYSATACLVSVCIPSLWFLLAGVLTTLAYFATGKLKNPTQKAEWLAGGLNFGLLYLCIGG